VPASNKPANTTEELSKLADSVISKLGLLLVSVNILQQGKRRVVNIAIHRKGGRVSLDDCEKVSRTLEAALDEQAASADAPVIEGAYVLDVESPGIDRVLKTDSEYRIFEGETVELKVKEQIAKELALPLLIKGTLVGLQDKAVAIKNPSSLDKPKSKSKAKAEGAPAPLKEELVLPLSSLYSVRLYPELSMNAAKEIEESDDEIDEEIDRDIDEETDE
jgi:ribosome maturation factor RimP